MSRKNYYAKLERLATGTGSKRIAPKDFLNIKISIPPIEKQNIEVNLFNSLIKKEEIINRNTLFLNNYKKYLLEKMFI